MGNSFSQCCVGKVRPVCTARIRHGFQNFTDVLQIPLVINCDQFLQNNDPALRGKLGVSVGIIRRASETTRGAFARMPYEHKENGPDNGRYRVLHEPG